MKLFLFLLMGFVSLNSLVAQSATSPKTTSSVLSQDYLLLTEKNNGGTFTLSPGEILCVRFENTETCTPPEGPNGSFTKNTCLYAFDQASSEDYLQLTKNLTGLYPGAESDSFDALTLSKSIIAPQKPRDRKIEKEWIFQANGTGTTTLTFSCNQFVEGYNGAPSPDSISVKSIVFNIITKTD